MTGSEIQPSARLMWRPRADINLWASISKAVRTPSHMEYYSRLASIVLPPDDPYNPVPFPLLSGIEGSKDFRSQKVIAHEIGYRRLLTDNLSVDLALFYNDYDDLRTFEYEKLNPLFNGSYLEAYLPIENGASGHTYGLELAVAWKPTDDLKIDATYCYIEESLTDMLLTFIHESPRNQVSFRGSWRGWDDITLDFWFKYIDEFISGYPYDYAIGQYPIDSYVAGDFQASWQISDKITFSALAKNIFANGHVEGIQEYYTYPTEVDKSFFCKIVYQF